MLLKKYPKNGTYHHSKNGTNTFVMNDGEAEGLTTTIVQNKNGDRWMKKSYTSGNHKDETYGKVEKITEGKGPSLLYSKTKLETSPIYKSYFDEIQGLENHKKDFYHLENKGKTIGFGHDLLPGEYEKFKHGITYDQAVQLLKGDLVKHKTLAESYFNDSAHAKKLGVTWDQLPEAKQVLFTDYTFNMGPGFYDKFQKFVPAVITGDKKAAAKESGRVATIDGVETPLTERNKWSVEFINKHL